MNPPWHPGEIQMQRSAGAEERMREVGPRVLRDHLIEQHQQFYPQLPFIILGAVDPGGEVWASVRTAAPGFLHSPDPGHLDVALDRDADDPACVFRGCRSTSPRDVGPGFRRKPVQWRAGRMYFG